MRMPHLFPCRRGRRLAARQHRRHACAGDEWATRADLWSEPSSGIPTWTRLSWPPGASRASTRATVENELFYLSFSQYIMLNQRPDPKPVDLAQTLANAASFEEFRDLVVQPPVQNEDDAALIAGLASRMEAIESMRNCVAHNRKPSRSTRENYDTALPGLHSLLDDYIDRLRREYLQ